MTSNQALKRITQLENELAQCKIQEEKKNHFFATTVHELRTPLNAIVGLSSILIDSDIKAPLSEYISQIDISSQLLTSLVNDILDFSKIEAGKMKIEHIPFPIASITDKIKNLIGMQAEQKGLQLNFNIDKKLPTEIIGDPLRLTQILLNLTSNALKFTPKGNITISIEPLQTKSDGNFIKFCVSDTGIGLTQEQTSRLFQDFTQADNSISRQYGGTGLGLTISKKFVEFMGGTIRVESKPNKGANFIFTIEQKDIVEGTEIFYKQRRGELKKDLLKYKNAHILLVDDDTINQSLIVALLKGTGIEISKANNGQEALDIIDKNDTINLILMDINMPIMGGLEATRTIRHNTKYSDTPIIAFSGDSDDATIAEAKESGMNDLLFKPIVAEDFYLILKKYLQTKQTTKQRYTESAKKFDTWLKDYKYQKILALTISIKQDSENKNNVKLLQSAALVEHTIEKYKNLFLVLIKNYTKTVQSYKQCVYTLEKSQNLTIAQDERLHSLMDDKSIKNIDTLALFVKRLENTTEEIVALVEMLEFNQATVLANSLQKEAAALFVHAIVKSISPILGIEATQLKQLKINLHILKDEIEKMLK